MSYDITVPRYSPAIKDSRQALYWNIENLEPEKFFSQDMYFFFPNYNCFLFFIVSYIYTVLQFFHMSPECPPDFMLSLITHRV